MLTEEQMYSIQDEVLNEMYQDDNFYAQFTDKYPEYCDYSAEYDVLVTEDETKEVEYEVSIPIDDVYEACISDLYRWLNNPQVADMLMNDDTYHYSDQQYNEFCQNKFVEFIDAWMEDKPPVRNLHTFDDFAYEYCEAYGNPVESY